MQAIRQIMQVVDRRVTIELPADFAGQQVEVIVQATQPPVNRRGLCSVIHASVLFGVGIHRYIHRRRGKRMRQANSGAADDQTSCAFCTLLDWSKWRTIFDAPLPDEDLCGGADCPGNGGRLHPGGLPIRYSASIQSIY